jgi:hypothetical protein
MAGNPDGNQYEGAVRLARHRAEQSKEGVAISPISASDRASDPAAAGGLLAQPASADTPSNHPRAGTPRC